MAETNLRAESAPANPANEIMMLRCETGLRVDWIKHLAFVIHHSDDANHSSMMGQLIEEVCDMVQKHLDDIDNLALAIERAAR